MRKHGRRGTLTGLVRKQLVLDTGQRRRIHLSFEPGRRACLWVLDEARPRVGVRH